MMCVLGSAVCIVLYKILKLRSTSEHGPFDPGKYKPLGWVRDWVGMARAFRTVFGVGSPEPGGLPTDTIRHLNKCSMLARRNVVVMESNNILIK